VIGSAAVLPVITMACWSLPRMPAPMAPCWLTCSKRPATGSSRHPRHDVSATAVRPDDLDAVLAARSTLVVPVTMLRNRRAGEVQTALQVLSVARDQLNADRLRCLNALTALLRSHNLGIDARHALTAAQICAIAIWRRREEPVGVATARAETVRLAKRILALDVELTDNRTEVTKLVSVQAPELLALSGVGAITAAVILTAWSHPGRIRSEARSRRLPKPARSRRPRATWCGIGSTAEVTGV
jgi:hypothetical protein